MSLLEIELGTIAHYQLEHLLARGGMSLVYLAYDIHTHQQVAIKLVHASEADDYERFQREASTLASLKNDHILPVFDHGEYDSWFYMAMPYVKYGSLRDRLAKGIISIHEAEAILTQLVDAVQYAHDRGIVHRDIKPSNILLRDGKHVYLADFGLVKHVGEMSDLTQTGYLIGTPEYMAPELTEQPATSSSDIYALGIVLYYMLTGRVPFKSTNPLGVYWKHLHEQPVAPSTYNQAISLATDSVILRALAKDPEQRFHSAKALLETFQASIKNERSITVNVVRVDPTITTTITRKSVIMARKHKTPLYRRMNMRVGALLILAASLLFALPALLYFSLPYGYDSTQASLIHASGPIFRNRIQTTTPSVQPTPTDSKTAGQIGINVSVALPAGDTSGNGQANHSGKDTSKHQKNKHKHGGKHH